jgi:acetyltransferase-like isoleucine patch superfamily enzyme
MRKAYLKLCKKLRYRWYFVYTWLHRSSLKSCGKRVRLEFPIRLEEPHRISLGDDVMTHPRVWLNPVCQWAGIQYNGEIIIGNRAKIGYDVQISSAASVVIEEDVAIASRALIVDHIHDPSHIDMPIREAPLSRPEPVRIGKGSFLGVNCFIGPGVQIGEHAVIAANAVVNKDVPSYCLALGNPARVLRYYTPLPENLETEAPCEVQLG